jgi:glycosyltransferase involved in cell wall biosynthesis
VVIYTVSPRGGSHASLATLVRNLDPVIDVSIVSTRPEVAAELARLRPGTDSCEVAPVRNKADLPGILRHARAVRALRPDVLHVSCDNQWSAPYGMLAGLISRCPTVAVVNGPAPAWRRRQEWLVRRVIRHLDAVVSVSDASARAIEPTLGLPRGKVRTIYNGVDIGSTGSADGGAITSTGRSGPVVGAVARLASEKGVDVLLRAMALLPGIRAVVAGDGPEREPLERLAHELGIASQITFAGWVEAPWPNHFTADVLVVPSRREGFGLVAAEALMAGIPVVASAVGGLSEVLEEGAAGLLVPPEDPTALACAIDAVLTDSQSARTRAARGLESARERFEPTVMARAYEALYEELAGRSGTDSARTLEPSR